MSVFYSFVAKVIEHIINPIVLLLSATAFVVFLWGIFEFVSNAENATKREEGQKAIFWGLIGLVIIFGSYGILNVALGTFNLGSYVGGSFVPTK